MLDMSLPRRYVRPTISLGNGQHLCKALKCLICLGGIERILMYVLLCYHTNLNKFPSLQSLLNILLAPIVSERLKRNLKRDFVAKITPYKIRDMVNGICKHTTYVATIASQNIIM